MKNKLKLIYQTCDSRECRKKFKSQITEVSDTISTIHTYNTQTREVVCTKCGKSYKLAK